MMLCPSRGRPGNIVKLREQWAKVTDSAELLVAVDDNDAQLGEYQAGGPVAVISEPRGLGNIINVLAAYYAPKYEYVGFLGDDHMPRTPKWDLILTSAMGGQAGVTYGDDLFQGVKVPTAMIVSSKLILGLGYIVPPGVEHLYMDCFWKVLGEATFLAWCPGVIMEHMHPSAGKGEWDLGYAKANSIEQYSRDEVAYQNFLNNRWPQDRDRLLEYLS
jgi:hypothetical protein